VRLTLVIGLRCQQSEKENPAVILAADTQFSGTVKESGHKVIPYPTMGILVGGSGSVSLTRHTASRFTRIMRKEHNGLFECARFDRFMEEDGEKLLREVVKEHIDVVANDGFGLLIAQSDSEDVRLYLVQEDGIPMRIDEDPGYGCIGRGYALGGAVLLRQFLESDLTTLRAARLAAYMIMAVHEVDGTVGEEPEIFQALNGKATRFNLPAEDIVKKRVTVRAGTLSSFWKLLDSRDVAFELRAESAFRNERFLSSLRQLIEKQKVLKPED